LAAWELNAVHFKASYACVVPTSFKVVKLVWCSHFASNVTLTTILTYLYIHQDGHMKLFGH
jgi:hypothetical protein